MFNRMRSLATVVACGVLVGSAGVVALDSDQQQPTTLVANDIALDLKTGVRTYRGDVVYRQGSIGLDCDQLLTYFNDDDALDKAICHGQPGEFKHRPQGSEHDMIGKADAITMDQIERTVVMTSNADMVQGETRLTGGLITYDLETGKVKAQANGDASSKPTLIIQPRNNKKPKSDDS